MNTQSQTQRTRRRGYALVLVLVMTGLGIFLLSSALSWTSNSSLLVQRNNQYFDTAAAAEAATESVLSRMARDYQIDGEPRIATRLADNTYQNTVPLPSEHSYWSGYQFSDLQGAPGQTEVQKTAAARWAQLEGQYRGLYGYESTYRVVSVARDTGKLRDIPTAVEQQIGLASIPLFQFAIFYNLDLEINPGPDMDITGPVHGNNSIFMEPHNHLTFWSPVTSAMDIEHHKKPGDPSSRPDTGIITYKDSENAHVSSLNLPIGTNNSPEAVHGVIEIPPATENQYSPMGASRYYNKADLIILVSNNTVTAKSGPKHSIVTLATNDWQQFVNTNVAFYDKREGKTIKTTQIDVGALKTWSATNNSLRPILGGDVSILYVADERSQSSGTKPGVRLVNGRYLPNDGLTVATPDPIYVKGHYNAPDTTPGNKDTSATKPASLVGDAITILSESWNDANSSSSVSSRAASHTTVNAAFLAGIVQTTGDASHPGNYSGGVENFPRFLETWSGRTFTYNGSMVVMFESQIATERWGKGDVYSPPKRMWAFDTNFTNPEKRPPGTPEVRAMVRQSWAMIDPVSGN